MLKEPDKIGITIYLRVSRCGDGHHFKIPKEVVDAHELESGDQVHVDLNYVRRARIKE